MCGVAWKKIDNIQSDRYVSGMSDSYNKEKKREYYLKNRESRIKYQKEWYRAHRARIARKRELDEEFYPEELLREKKYQRDYYQRNKDRIRSRRNAKRLEKKTSFLPKIGSEE